MPAFRGPATGRTAHGMKVMPGRSILRRPVYASPPLPAMWVHSIRPIVDRGLGAMLAVATIPVQLMLLALTWWAFRATPVIVQQRIGLDGRPFPLLKLRTLSGADTSAENTLTWQHDHNRLTPFGAFLRRTGLDEILQLWNIVAGQMAIVGPRPWLEHEERAVEQLWPDARRRLSVRPGLIGLSAVLYRRPASPSDYLAHAATDLEYVDTASPALDVRICWRALGLVVGGRDRAPVAVHLRANRP
jgi:lipopolysaccharide/colanic/teichoic acid biosynthesis glycosyltransferase